MSVLMISSPTMWADSCCVTCVASIRMMPSQLAGAVDLVVDSPMPTSADLQKSRQKIESEVNMGFWRALPTLTSSAPCGSAMARLLSGPGGCEEAWQNAWRSS